MKKCLLILFLLAGCHSPVHNPVYTGPGPVDYETMVTIHHGLQEAAFHRRFILIEEKEKEMEVEVAVEWLERDKAVLSGVKYYLEGITYYWHENHFHYRNRPSMPDGLTPRTRMVWVAICNPDRERYIFENGTRHEQVQE